jgi:EAL domain-containing protein (putative c-di-GMP-specific phosphodiesterase class I)
MSFKKSNQHPADTLTVLVIEPNKFERRCLCRLLRAAGAERVAEAPDFETARRLLGVRRWSTWLLVAEPDRLGDESLAEMRDLAGTWAIQSVLLLTQGRPPAGDALRARALQHGLPVAAVLRKPVSAEEAGTVLRSAATRPGIEPPVPLLSAEELNDCLRSGRIQMRFAPMVDLHSGAPFGCEAAACVVHLRYGEVPEAGFRHAMAQLGAQRMMTATILREAAALARALRGKQLGAKVCVNLAPEMLTEAGDANALDSYVRTLGVGPDDLVLELDAGQGNACRDVAENLARLKLRGYLLALDRPGASVEFTHSGYEHFAELKLSWPPTTGAPGHSGEEADRLAAALAGARRRGMATCAVGLRTGADLEQARRAGFDLGQGELFAGTMPAAETLLWLEREERGRSFADRAPAQNQAG